MKALKILVLFMGAVLVVGFGFLIWGLTGRGSGNAARSVPKAGSIAADAPGFGQIHVPLPTDGKVEQMLPSDGRIAVHVSGNGGDHIIILDPLTGRVTGEFVFDPARP